MAPGCFYKKNPRTDYTRNGPCRFPDPVYPQPGTGNRRERGTVATPFTISKGCSSYARAGYFFVYRGVHQISTNAQNVE